MAAIDGDRSAALIAAALALPGIAPGAAHAQAAPDQKVIALRYLDYRDWQPGASRMSVRSPSLYALLPLSDTLAFEGSLVHDSMSGASPLYHDTLSGASGLGVTDYRVAGDARLTRYFDSQALAIGAAYSHERDYISRAASVEWRRWSADRNRSYALGLGAAHDAIDGTTGAIRGKHRETWDALLGITQVVNAEAIVDAQLTWSDGRGEYSDPYKPLDTRPDRRRVLALLARYNRHFAAPDATLRLAWRYLRDSFGDRSHMLEASWVQPLPRGFALTPTVRYLTQTAADFYRDPPFPQGYVPGEPYTADTRLAAFGALTLGLRLERQFAGGVVADVVVDVYRQRAAWRLGGDGSPGLSDFSARWIEFGLSRTF
ncbi:MAG: DUF3570 domain-containing protein [Candidatus Levyibacteriota bacterium]